MDMWGKYAVKLPSFLSYNQCTVLTAQDCGLNSSINTYINNWVDIQSFRKILQAKMLVNFLNIFGVIEKKKVLL